MDIQRHRMQQLLFFRDASGQRWTCTHRLISLLAVLSLLRMGEEADVKSACNSWVRQRLETTCPRQQLPYSIEANESLLDLSPSGNCGSMQPTNVLSGMEEVRSTNKYGDFCARPVREEHREQTSGDSP